MVPEGGRQMHAPVMRMRGSKQAACAQPTCLPCLLPCLQAAPAFPDSFPHMFGERKDVR